MEVEIEYIAMAGSLSNAPNDWQRDLLRLTTPAILLPCCEGISFHLPQRAKIKGDVEQKPLEGLDAGDGHVGQPWLEILC